MPAPKNRKLRKTYWHVAIRTVAVRAAHTAFPHLGMRELGASLGLTRSQVRHYLLGDAKSADNRQPAWAEEFFAACRDLARGQTTQASFHLSSVAQLINAAGDPARKHS